MSERIAAVVVTFNRKDLLLECLSGLLKQTRALDKIFVIDNASTDGTGDALLKSGYIDNPLFEYVCLDNNTGGAGGFYEGVKRAFEAGYDWFWLMDDDVEPYPNALENLIPYSNISGCIHGRRREVDGSPNDWGHRFCASTVSTSRLSRKPLFLNGEEFYDVNVGCFEGMLVSKGVVARIGFPDPEFFIALDDSYFGYCASKVTKVLYVNAFTLARKRPTGSFSLGAKSVTPLSNLALRYYQRNRFLIASKEGGVSLGFFVETARGVVAGVVRELLVSRSVGRVRVLLSGVIEGARLYARKKEY